MSGSSALSAEPFDIRQQGRRPRPGALATVLVRCAAGPMSAGRQSRAGRT
jgi:hypothetical protein